MTSPPEPSPSGDTAAALAVQVAALRGQVRLIFARLDKAGLTGDLNLADRFAELARTVTEALDTPPHGPAAPYWIGLSPQDHAAQLAELRQWTDTVAAPRIRRLPAPRLLGKPPPRHLGTVHPGRRMAPHLQPQTTRPGPGARIPRPVATRHHAPHRRHHPPVQPRMRRPATGSKGGAPAHALRPAAATGSGKGPTAMTTVKLSPG